MFSVWYGLYLFLFSMGLALIEIQIEGKHGWAEKLPCWRPVAGSFIDKIWLKVTGKQLTGYHVTLFGLVFLTLHLPFFVGFGWTLVRELEIISSYLLICVAEDFLWFVFNPYYGIRKFKPEYIWWHRKWIGNVMPTDFPVGIGIAFGFSLIAAALKGGEIVVGFMIVSVILFGLVFLTVLVAVVKNCFEDK